MAKNDPVVPPPTPQKDEDEEFFKEHGIEDNETKDGFRQRYLLTKYTKFREGKEKPPEQPPTKKKGFLFGGE